MSGLTALEGQALLFIQDHLRHPALTVAMRGITSLGNMGAFWIVLTLLLLAFPSTRRVGAVCATALILGFLVSNVALKNIARRVRPYDMIEGLKLLVARERDWSFPSGHATSSFAAAWGMFRRLPKRYGVPALILAILIALSRLYVGVHYPTDVLCGAIVGILAGEVAVRVEKRAFSKIFPEKS